MQAYKYTTSVNIVRDSDRDLNYHPTPNAIRVVGQIGSDFAKGLRSFSIIGTYGTGKSSLLWAFQNSLKGNKDFFDISLLPNATVEILNMVGEYRSIIDVFAERLDLGIQEKTSENIFAELFQRYYSIDSSNKIYVIIIDEFGKFLEYAAKHNPEKELYFIQQLTEFINNSDHNLGLITSVHQNFDAYSQNLTNSQQQEWRKIKGRFREITFNEPVEQLLYLAAEHLKEKEKSKSFDDLLLDLTVDLTIKTKAFRLEKNSAQQIAIYLYPLDLLAAGVLALSLQRYGQNERSLFSFLESTDYTSIDKVSISQENPFYNLANVYDYLLYNFYPYLQSKNNHDYFKWVSIRSALESVERNITQDVDSCIKLVKTIGLLSIWVPRGADLGEDFLTNYAISCLGIARPGLIIQRLEEIGVIFFRMSNKRFILFEGSDLDIQLALNEASGKINTISDIASLLNTSFSFPSITANKYSYQTGTPRVFDFIISDSPTEKTPYGETDGFINLLFSDDLSIEDIQEKSASQNEAILYGYFNKVSDIKELLTEISKAEYVIEQTAHDAVAVKELTSMIEDYQRLLKRKVFSNFFTDEVTWIFNGVRLQLSGKKAFNKCLSEICAALYPSTPIFKNELVNRHKISASIHSAKRLYFQALGSKWQEDGFGFPNDRFPPEKTIFLTLVKENGLSFHAAESSSDRLIHENSSFLMVWDECMSFIEQAKQSRKKVSDLVSRLSEKPFKLKQGLIDFWVPTFLFSKRNDFAMFSDEGYNPVLTGDILERISKSPEKFEIKAFALDGIRLDLFNSYRTLLNQSSKLKFDNLTFIETIRPFLSFYTKLPTYSKNTQRLSKEALTIRAAIARSVDPEKTFFEDFPIALGYSLEHLYSSKVSLEEYTAALENAIRDIRTAYDNLIDRFDEFICNEYIGKTIPFEEYKYRLQARFANLHKYLLLPNQKTFIQRLDSALDDRNAWLNSIAQAVVGKTLDVLTDKEEILLYDKFKRLILELDSLTNLSEVEIDQEYENAVSLEINTFVDGLQKKLVRLPKTKTADILSIEKSVRAKLSADDSISIAALVNLLNELLKK
ncbi:hypothetical protein [Dyadobacter sp. 32]|uniref:hypothetical protein n=1 Tax=Dyadobacter sp. 32 TaxID=538966 RepID=UPI0011ED8AAA